MESISTLISFFIAIVLLLMFLYSYKKNKSNKSTLIIEEKEQETDYSLPAVNETTFEVVVEDDFFADHFRKYETDSYLTPSETKKELKERKENGEYLSDDEYYGYLEIIHSDKADEYCDLIFDMTPEQAINWYNRKRNNGTWLTYDVMVALKDKIAPYHENQLLTLLEKVPNGRVRGWVNARKKEGYFFTDLVYEECRKKDELYNARKKN